jgi:hypothetical protein
MLDWVSLFRHITGDLIIRLLGNNNDIIAYNIYVFVMFANYLSSLYEIEVLTAVGVNVLHLHFQNRIFLH